VFRRRPTGTSEVLETDEAAPAAEDADSRQRPGVTAPKGVPTPKRSEAQANRRQPYQAPADRKAAARQTRERGRADRLRRTQALQRGENWALPRKDQGPIRALARDVVDAHRGVGEFYMIIVLLLIVLLVIPSQTVKLAGEGVVILLLVLALGEGWFLSARTKRLARERYPGQSTQGIVLYVTMRGISMRRMRVPKPRVKPGDKI
jgi:Protein of unknown function (DUF3043)